MKKLFVVLMLFTLAVIAGCLTSSNDNKDNSGGGTGTGGTNTYLPLKLGATWTYEETYDVGGQNSKSTYVENIVGTVVQGGKTYWMVEDKYQENSYSYADTSLMRIEGNIVYGFFENNLTGKPALKTAKAARAAKVLIYTTGIEVPFLKFGLSSGQTWTIYDSGVIVGTHVKSTGKSLGTESVTVPAGSFSGCAKIETTTETTTTNTSGTQTSKYVLTMWVAANVGIVKETDVDTWSDGTNTSSYQNEMTLMSYSIPK